MARNDHRFLTTWRVHATPQEVVDVLSDASDLPRWWPSVGGPVTRVEYDWRIRAQKGLLKVLSPVMRPLFSANHHWAMAQGN